MKRTSGQSSFFLIVGTIVMILSIYYFVRSYKSKELMIDSMESKIARDTTSYGSSPDSSVEVKAARNEARCGIQSLKLIYDLKPGGYIYCGRGYDINFERDYNNWARGKKGWLMEPEDIEWEKYQSISFAMLGNKQGGKMDFYVMDANREMWGFAVDNNFKGWKIFNINFEDFKIRNDWQPYDALRDGRLNFPLRSYFFQPRTVGQGALYFDCVKLNK